jgi:hypothetical protein
MWGWIARLIEPQPEIRAIGKLQTLAAEHDGEFHLSQLDDGNTLARIEWYAEERGKVRIYGGDGRGKTPQLAATELLARLRRVGLA